MVKKESSYAKNMKNQNLDPKNLKTSANSNIRKDKSLPWWVEFLFVQIGLPDKLLIKILKIKKASKDLAKNKKKFIFAFIIYLITLTYFYPVVKQSKSKLECEHNARSYISNYKNLLNLSSKQLKMLSTNFCNGGEEINEIKK